MELWGDFVVLEARVCLERLMPTWIETARRIVIYAAGRHTQGLFENGDFCRLNIIGIVDRNLALQGQQIHGCTIYPVSEIAFLAPEVILVSSPPYHETIMGEFGKQWQEAGIDAIDICEGAKPYSPLFPLALKHGLALDDSHPGEFRISSVGTPRRVILHGSHPWEGALDLIKAFDHYFESVEPVHVAPDEMRVDFRQPAYHRLKASGLRFFFPSHPETEDMTLNYLDFADLRAGDTVVDLGAYAGLSTFFFSRAVGKEGKVIAVEPDDRSLDALRRNVADYGLVNVSVEAGALWDKDGEELFQAEGGMSSGVAGVLGRTSLAKPVRTFTLETLLQRHRLEKVAFMKLDIEGAELSVLSQAMPLLRKIRPRMVIEAHLYKNGASNLPDLIALLEAGGFSTVTRGQGMTEFPLVLAQWGGCAS